MANMIAHTAQIGTGMFGNAAIAAERAQEVYREALLAGHGAKAASEMAERFQAEEIIRLDKWIFANVGLD